MLAMQYGFDLPDSFDMDAVRRRIEEIGSRFDGLPGLHLKAFLVAGRTATAPNRYAPFYLWRDTAGMTAFLTSESFRAVEAKYGRPTVNVWSSLASLPGPASHATPVYATQQFVDVPAKTDLGALATAERSAAEAMAGEPELHSLFVGLDPHAWQLNRTAFWKGTPPPSAKGRTFELRYLASGDAGHLESTKETR